MDKKENDVIQKFEHQGKALQLFELDNKRVRVLATDGMRNIKLPVPHNTDEKEHIELFVCLPSYWDLEDPSPNFQWPKDWLVKLWKYVEENKTWLGHGHTIRCFADYAPISETMKPNHLFILQPYYLENELAFAALSNFQFLALTPIFGEEMDYKQAKGTYKLLKKLHAKNHTEKLDDFRESVMNGRLKMFR